MAFCYNEPLVATGRVRSGIRAQSVLGGTTMNIDRPKPVDPVWRDLVASRENYLRETTMLVDAIEIALGEGAINGSIAGVLRQRAQAVRQARCGEGRPANRKVTARASRHACRGREVCRLKAA
jgi:hypothetical protein